MTSVNLCHHIFHPFSQNGVQLDENQKRNAKLGLVLCAFLVVPGLVAFSSIALWYKYKNLNTVIKQPIAPQNPAVKLSAADQKTHKIFHKLDENVPFAFTIHNEKQFKSVDEATKFVLSNGNFQRIKKDGVCKIGGPDSKLRRNIRYASNQFPDCMSTEMLNKHRNANPDAAFIIQLKRLGHVFALKDSVPVGQDFLQFEGFTPHLTASMLSASLASFYSALDEDNRPEWLTPDRFSWVQKSLANLLFSNVVDQNELQFIGEQVRQADFNGSIASASGFNTHTTVTGFMGPIGYILNRGAHAKPSGGTLYLIPDRSLITDNALEDIIRSGNLKEESCFGHNAMINELGAKVLTTFKLPPQKSGNCTYKSVEAFIFMLFAAQCMHYEDPHNFLVNSQDPAKWKEAFSEVRPLFDDFVNYDRRLIYDDLMNASAMPGKHQPVYQLVLDLVEQSEAFLEMMDHEID